MTIVYLSYKQFAVGPASEQYPLTISGFTGYTTDPFLSHLTPSNDGAELNMMKFTTWDQDNDHWGDYHCSVHAHSGGSSGWWYNNCVHIIS